MKRFGTAHHRHTDMNITPLIDVVFILLVFFVVCSRFNGPSIPIELPIATSGERTEYQPVTITIDDSETVYLDGTAISAAALSTQLTSIVTEDPQVRAALEADGSVSFAVVTTVLDSLKQAGLRHVAIKHEVPR